MVARACQWVLRWFRIGCLLPRDKRAPLMFLWHFYPEIYLWSFNGSLWDVLLRCSKWLQGVACDSFTMILRCWLVVWVKWARPLVSMTLWSRVMFNWKAVSSQWGNFGTLLPPRGASLPHWCGMSYRARQPLQMWQISHFYENPLSELWVCEFWLLRCSTMVARAWPVCVEWFRIGCLLPESNEPTLMFLWHFYPEIPLISFNGSLWDVLLRCSKWLQGRGLIASQWSWDADWSSESMSPPPCLYDTVIQSYVQLKSGSIERTAHFMGRLHHWSQWGKF